MRDAIDVLIVDDSAFMRSAVDRLLRRIDGVRVVATAATGVEAVERAREHEPDLILLDVNMPVMDGLEALRQIMDETPTAVILLSSLARQDTDVTLRALELGAVDFIDKGSVGQTMDIHAIEPVLRDKIQALFSAGPIRARPAPTWTIPGPVREAKPPTPPRTARRGPYDLVIIGTSTGGPRALSRLIPALPAGFTAPVVVAQHMPSGFTAALAARLDAHADVIVREAGTDGEALEPGCVYVVAAGHQAHVEHRAAQHVLRITDGKESDVYRPSIDRLLHSTADEAGRRAIGVVLTGMGRDGADGLAALRAAGGRTIAESEETAVIYGMPREAAAAAQEILPLHTIADRLVELCAATETRAKGSP